ncbi:MAG: hypothetical protein WCP21_01575 [Armatimonadota bacterium]
MDARIVEFVEKTAQNIVGLDVALFFQANPRTFDTAAGVALRTHRGIDEVSAALTRLAGDGILEGFQRGDGKYICYAIPSDPRVWNVLCLLSEAYLDRLEDRKEIIRLLMRKPKAADVPVAAKDDVSAVEKGAGQ